MHIQQKMVENITARDVLMQRWKEAKRKFRNIAAEKGVPGLAIIEGENW